MCPSGKSLGFATRGNWYPISVGNGTNMNSASACCDEHAHGLRVHAAQVPQIIAELQQRIESDEYPVCSLLWDTKTGFPPVAGVAHAAAVWGIRGDLGCSGRRGRCTVVVTRRPALDSYRLTSKSSSETATPKQGTHGAG